MDKQMIEEMAGCKDCYDNLGHCPSQDNKEICPCYKNAVENYKQGYRKIPENAVVLTEERLKAIIEEEYKKSLKGKVVLTKEEAEQVYRTVKAHGELLKDLQEAKSVFEEEMEEAQKKFVKQLEEAEKEIRKETAEKFAERLKAECFDGGIDDKRVAVSFSRLDEIAMEFTGK